MVSLVLQIDGIYMRCNCAGGSLVLLASFLVTRKNKEHRQKSNRKRQTTRKPLRKTLTPLANPPQVYQNNI
jgi:hypothetical protein